MLKNGTPASPATARASSVLPVPGGPTSSTPRGMRAPSCVELLGVLEELDDFLQLLLGLIHAGHVLEGDDGLIAQEHPRAALAERDRLVVGALRLPQHEEEQRADEQHRQQRRQQQAQPLAAVRGDAAEELWRRGAIHRSGAGGVDVRLDVGSELAGHQRGLDDRLARLVGLLELDLERLATLGHLGDVALRHERKERLAGPAVGDRLCGVGGEDEHVQQRRGANDEHERDDAVPEESVVQGVGRPPGHRARPRVLRSGDYRWTAAETPAALCFGVARSRYPGHRSADPTRAMPARVARSCATAAGPRSAAWAPCRWFPHSSERSGVARLARAHRPD